MKICLLCSREVYARGLCYSHYVRDQRAKKLRKCFCGEGHYAKGLCPKHYMREYREIRIEKPTTV